jgi:bifunctional non-homologous end joining protein LigD
VIQRFNALPPEARQKIRRRVQPAWYPPMLATLVREPFSDPNWIFEPKLDGIRCLAFRKGRGLTLFSRNQLRLNERYPELLPALAKQSCSSFVVDGEIVAFDRGVSRFSVLQKRRQIHVPVFYHLFDLLYLDGYDLTGLELRYRRKLLHDSFQFADPVRYSQDREAEGQAFYKEACTRGWEGIIGKRGNSIYVPGRSMDWLKFKCENEQEFVIVGYSEPTGQRVGLGALLVGFHENGELVYAGKVGTGFDTATLKELENKLKALERATPAVVSESLPRKGIHWVQPKLVAQIAFTEWTDAGKLRHPRYLGLRRDKKPAEVVREKPKDLRRR